MRLVAPVIAAIAMLGLAAVPAEPAVGEIPVSTQPLASGEVLLELMAIGRARQRADLATFSLSISCYAATEAEALRSLDRQIEAVREAARAFGARDDEIRVGGASASIDPSDALMSGADTLEESEAPVAGQQHAARARVEIRLRDVDRVPQLKARLRSLGIADTGGPTYSLTDDRAARRRARDDAVRTLRADADAYRVSLGMRAVRLVRVGERLGPDVLTLMAAEGLVSDAMDPVGDRGDAGSEAEVSVFVSADFALAPQ